MKKPEVRKKYHARLMDVSRRYPVYIPFLNSIIRYTFSKKFHFDLRKISKQYEDRDEEIARWYNQRVLFFGFGVFRSGTTFLADFLNRNLSEAIVQHEPNVNDYYSYADALQNELNSYSYIKEYRLKEIYHRIHPFQVKTYGEINPFLRRHAAALREYCPQAKQFYLVRNGTDVLRSLMSRELFGINDPMAKLIYPPQEDSFLEKWKTLSRFEKLCWLWKSDNEYLRKNIPHQVHFEKLLSDYDYFKTAITDYLGIETIGSDIWQNGIGKVVHQTPKYHFHAYGEWEQKEKNDFERICGEEMAKSGY